MSPAESAEAPPARVRVPRSPATRPRGPPGSMHLSVRPRRSAVVARQIQRAVASRPSGTAGGCPARRECRAPTTAGGGRVGVHHDADQLPAAHGHHHPRAGSDPIAQRLGNAVGVRGGERERKGDGGETLGHLRRRPRPGAVGSETWPPSMVAPTKGSLGQEGGTVQVHDVHQRREVRRGGDPDRALDHAADHHHQAVRPRDGDHPDRLPEAPALGELDVDPVHLPDQRRNVGRRLAALVRDHRDVATAG